VGALMAIARWRGMPLESTALRWVSMLGFAGYLAFFTSHALGGPVFGLRFLQQTLLAIALCGFIASGSIGFRGALGKFLEWPHLLRIGQLSYGIYLFHNLAPMVAGKIMPFLWNGWFENGVPALLKVAIFALITWAMALASWRWIESPLQSMRARMLGSQIK